MRLGGHSNSFEAFTTIRGYVQMRCNGGRASDRTARAIHHSFRPGIRRCLDASVPATARILGKALIPAMLLAAILSVAVRPAQAEASLLDLDVSPLPRLGLAFPGADPGRYRAATEIGVGVVRLGVFWSQLQPRAGTHTWSDLDFRVAELQRLGAEPFITLYSDAPWATRPTDAAARNRVPSSLSSWAGLVGAVVERYDADGTGDAPGLLRPLKYIQVANEWTSRRNASGGWAGTTEELITYVDAAYDAAKKASPGITFVLGGVGTFNLDALAVTMGRADHVVQQRWSPTRMTRLSEENLRSDESRRFVRDRILPVLRSARYDAASVHLYGPVRRDPLRIALVRELSGGRPVLATECGGPSLDYQERYLPEEHFLAAAERTLLVLSQGVPFCLWFRLAEGSGTYGNRYVPLFTADGVPKPGAYAYRLLARLLYGSEGVARLADRRFSIRRAGAPPITVAFGLDRVPAGLETILGRPPSPGEEIVRVVDPAGGRYDKMAARPGLVLAAPLVVLGEGLPLP